MREIDKVYERNRQILLDGTAKNDDEALQNPIDLFRFVVMDVERADDTTARIILRFAQVPDIVAPYLKSTDTRIAILFSLVDENRHVITMEDPFAELEEFVGTGCINDTTIIGTEADGTLVVDAR